MKGSLHKTNVLFLLFVILLFDPCKVKAVVTVKSGPEILNDSVTLSINTHKLILKEPTRKEIKKTNKELRRKELKESHSRLFIHAAYVFANLDTRVTFARPDGILKATIGIEKNLGLPSHLSFFSGSAIYRFTPSSGLYVNYYGFNRKHAYTTKEDLYWMGDTIPAGTASVIFFKTRVFSAGYLLSILKKPYSFLGTYINFYVMPLKIGINSGITNFNRHLHVVAPLPNIGLIAMFRLTKWLWVQGNIGVFSLYTKSLGGYIQDLNISFPVRINRWLSVSFNYQKFYVHALFPDQKLDTYVDYTFHGPAVGLTFNL